MTMTLLPFLLLLLAIIVLYFGAEFTLEAAEKIGKLIGLSPFVIGMLLIGFGTSLPEMFVGHIAALEGQMGIALGSLVGSNIANMCLILGVCSLITNLSLGGKQILKHLVIHLLLCLVLAYVLSSKVLSPITAIPLLSIVFIYLFTIISDVRKGDDSPGSEELEDTKVWLIVLKLLIGFFMLYVGGELLVYSGTKVALYLGISEYIVSSILIAFGTSFPELVTALMAALKRKDTNLIVGNIIGSNIFNCAFILGSLGFYNLELDGSYFYEMIALSSAGILLCCLSVFNQNINKFFGSLLLGLYFFMVGHWIDIL